MHVYIMFGYQECTATYCQAGSTELADKRSDGKGSRMSFTFTDADYIKTYIILPLYHMWAKHIPVACKCWGWCPSNLWTWDSTDNPRALLHCYMGPMWGYMSRYDCMVLTLTNKKLNEEVEGKGVHMTGIKTLMAPPLTLCRFFDVFVCVFDC